jgi:hypothetical protein
MPLNLYHDEIEGHDGSRSKVIVIVIVGKLFVIAILGKRSPRRSYAGCWEGERRPPALHNLFLFTYESYFVPSIHLPRQPISPLR